MNRRKCNLSSKEQVELLFDELFDITCKRKGLKKSAGPSSSDVLRNTSRSFEDDDVVSDSKKRYSGSFSREKKKVGTRSPLADEETAASDVPEQQPTSGSNSVEFQAQGPLVARGHNAEAESLSSDEGEAPGAASGEGPTEEIIHETAYNIALMGDELDDDYKKKLDDAGDRLAESLNKEKEEVTYDVFSKLLTDVIPLDQDVNTFMFFVHLCTLLFWKLGFSFTGYLKRFLSERYSEQGASVIRQQQEKMGSR